MSEGGKEKQEREGNFYGQFKHDSYINHVSGTISNKPDSKSPSMVGRDKEGDKNKETKRKEGREGREGKEDKIEMKKMWRRRKLLKSGIEEEK